MLASEAKQGTAHRASIPIARSSACASAVVSQDTTFNQNLSYTILSWPEQNVKDLFEMRRQQVHLKNLNSVALAAFYPRADHPHRPCLEVRQNVNDNEHLICILLDYLFRDNRDVRTSFGLEAATKLWWTTVPVLCPLEEFQA